jgi:molybdenum cofactor cytidylyltransferase
VGTGGRTQASPQSPIPSPQQHPFACLVLAAGAGTRFGEPKVGARLPSGERFLDAVVRVASEAGAHPVVVVVPPGIVVPGPARGVENPDSGGEQIASIRLGVAALANTRVEGVLVWPVDHPFVLIESVLAVIDGYRRTQAPIVIPTYEGRRGHPAFFARGTWPDLMTVASGGARSVLRMYASQVHELPVPDPGVVLDIDTRSDMPPGGWRATDALSRDE